MDIIIKGITRFIPVNALIKFPNDTPNMHKLIPMDIV